MRKPALVYGAGFVVSEPPSTLIPAATATNFRRFEKNTLKALFDLELPGGLVLCGCTLHFRERWWVGFPGRPYKDQDGNETWAKIVDFSSKDSRDRFQTMALAAALTAYEGSQSGRRRVMGPAFDRSSIEGHICVLHDLAAGCDGILILAAFEECGPAHVQQFRIGDADRYRPPQNRRSFTCRLG